MANDDINVQNQSIKELEEAVAAEVKTLSGGTTPQTDEFKKRISELEEVYKRIETKIQGKKEEIKAGLERLKVLKTELAKEIEEVKSLEAIDQKIKDEMKHLEELQIEVNKANV